MALWQADFLLVPRRALAAHAQPLAARTLRETDWWAGASAPPDLRQRIAAFVPAAPSDTAGTESWGRADGDAVELTERDGRVTRILVRVDVRRPDPKFSAGVLLLARAAGCALVRADGHVVEPVVGPFSAALKSSTAWRAAHGAPADAS